MPVAGKLNIPDTRPSSSACSNDLSTAAYSGTRSLSLECQGQPSVRYLWSAPRPGRPPRSVLWQHQLGWPVPLSGTARGPPVDRGGREGGRGGVSGVVGVGLKPLVNPFAFVFIGSNNNKTKGEREGRERERDGRRGGVIEERLEEKRREQ